MHKTKMIKLDFSEYERLVYLKTANDFGSFTKVVKFLLDNRGGKHDNDDKTL